MKRRKKGRKEGLKVVKLAESGLAWSERFTFYDQVHTTGMDIKQAVDTMLCVVVPAPIAT